jgi:hypothetical protein
LSTGVLKRRHATAIAAAALAFSGLLVSVEAAQAKADGETTRVSLDVSAERFVVEGDDVVARGPVTARVERPDGTTETLTQQVELKVKTTEKCRILELHLAKLYLNLLGLEVRTSEINLSVTGEPKQALGKLFCSLSEGIKLDRGALAKRSAASLNKALAKSPLPILSFKAPVRSQQQPPQPAARPSGRDDVPPVPPGSCEVLDLLLGPLHLDLLGLVVDLYGPTPADAVRVLVTANPNGGAIGSALCQVGGQPTA